MHTLMCDLGDRVVLVDSRPQGKPKLDATSSVVTLAGTVTVVTRATGKRVSAPISRGVDVDNCGGTSGGHAGCSASGGIRIESRALGTSVLAFRPGHDDVLVGKTGESACREPDGASPLALCATWSWFVAVDETTIRVFPFDDDVPLAEDPMIIVTSERYAGKHASFVLGKRASIALNGAREACL